MKMELSLTFYPEIKIILQTIKQNRINDVQYVRNRLQFPDNIHFSAHFSIYKNDTLIIYGKTREYKSRRCHHQRLEQRHIRSRDSESQRRKHRTSGPRNHWLPSQDEQRASLCTRPSRLRTVSIRLNARTYHLSLQRRSEWRDYQESRCRKQ